jgi:drug/metabolite transporter (DMT)-like permease
MIDLARMQPARYGEVMDTPSFKYKRRQLTLVLTIAGFVIAGGVCAYTQLTDASPQHVNAPLWAAFMVFCPAALLAIPLIDIEPGTPGFFVMWLIVAIMNSGLYAVIGFVVGYFLWKRENQAVQSTVPPGSPRE